MDTIKLTKDDTVVTLIPVGDTEYMDCHAEGGVVLDQDILSFGTEAARDYAINEHAEILEGRGYVRATVTPREG
jgi:hypothetical protein